MDRISSDDISHDTIFESFPGASLEFNSPLEVSYALDHAFIKKVKVELSTNLAQVKIFVLEDKESEPRELVWYIFMIFKIINIYKINSNQ